MRRIKGLMPSLKEKKRYMHIEMITIEKNTNFIGRPLTELVQKINQNLGIIDAAGAGIIPIDLKNNHALIRVSAKYLDRIKTTLLFINEISAQKIILKTKKVSGSINKARLEPRDI
ncbi:MAG: Rpp14/Pop5 family protein [Candidatus Woesearchaeota archaeon]